MSWLGEISADLREAVAHRGRVRDDALYKWPRLLYFTSVFLRSEIDDKGQKSERTEVATDNAKT